MQTFVFSLSLLFPIFNFFLLHDVITKQFSFRKHQEDIHLVSFIVILTLLFYFFIFSLIEI